MRRNTPATTGMFFSKRGPSFEERENTGETKSAGLAAVLSFLIPGLGQIYNGQIGKGLALVLLALVSFFLWIFLIGIPISIILWIYSIYDAHKGAELYNRAHAMRCPRCGNAVPQGTVACPTCGQPLMMAAPVPGAPQPGYLPQGYPQPPPGQPGFTQAPYGAPPPQGYAPAPYPGYAAPPQGVLPGWPAPPPPQQAPPAGWPAPPPTPPPQAPPPPPGQPPQWPQRPPPP